MTAGLDMEISMLMCQGMSLDDEEIQRTFGGKESWFANCIAGLQRADDGR